jgi:hypothetical protein
MKDCAVHLPGFKHEAGVRFGVWNDRFDFTGGADLFGGVCGAGDLSRGRFLLERPGRQTKPDI